MKLSSADAFYGELLSKIGHESYKDSTIKNVNEEFDSEPNPTVFDPNLNRDDGKGTPIDEFGTADDDTNYQKLTGYIPNPNGIFEGGTVAREANDDLPIDSTDELDKVLKGDIEDFDRVGDEDSRVKKSTEDVCEDCKGTGTKSVDIPRPSFDVTGNHEGDHFKPTYNFPCKSCDELGFVKEFNEDDYNEELF